jgi:hypothetical protein
MHYGCYIIDNLANDKPLRGCPRIRRQCRIPTNILVVPRLFDVLNRSLKSDLLALGCIGNL